MPTLELEVASGDELSVRRFVVRERISAPFEVELVVVSRNPAVPLEAIVGHPATFRIESGLAGAQHKERRFHGVCRRGEQERAAPTGLSTYRLEIVASVWLLTQRRDHAIFQHESAPAIASGLLRRWRIEHALLVDAEAHPPLPYKVQYGETDYAFLCRLLEEAGISYLFGEDGELLLDDRPHAREARAASIPFESSPNESAEREFVSEVHLAEETRPGAFVLRDHDLRRPAYVLAGEGERATGPEAALEQYLYQPGASLMETTPSGDTPTADDEAAARHNAGMAERQAKRWLESLRADRRTVAYRTNALHLRPGRLFTLTDHPHPHLEGKKPLLVTELVVQGSPGGDWTVRGQAVHTDVAYRPARSTPRPRARIQSATVVGAVPVHVDELGRVRVRFAWDRYGQATTWVRVSQEWAGAGFGAILLPRPGHEVLVDFLEGDPEQPVIVGRVFDQANPVPERLPEHATRSAWRSEAPTGFNEILFEDAKGSEIVYAQAERDARRLVKNDDTSTIVHDRRKDVASNELETTLARRVQDTGRDRVELTFGDETLAVEGARRAKVGKEADEQVFGERRTTVGGDRHLVTGGTRRELEEQHMHLAVGGRLLESVGGTDGLIVGKALNESVGDYSVDASGPDGWIHLVAGASIVIESASDATVKGPGGFVAIDGGGVTIVGALVTINEGGSPGSLPGPGPQAPERPKTPVIDEPEPPPAVREPGPPP
jgi:type VI secretion system secreted protein VgrG